MLDQFYAGYRCNAASITANLNHLSKPESNKACIFLLTCL